MKTPMRTLTIPATLVAALFTLTARAQPEQWLEYHTGTEPKGYRWLDLSTNPPPKVTLPKLEKGALFGLLVQRARQNGRTLVLPRPHRPERPVRPSVFRPQRQWPPWTMNHR